MKLKQSALLLSLALTLGASEDVNRVNINFENVDGKINPNISIPMHWSKHFYSSIGYTSRTVTTIDTNSITNSNEDRSALVSNQAFTRLNVLSFQSNIGKKFNYSLGAETEWINMQENSFGYFSHPGIDSGDYIAFDNSIELDVMRTNAIADISYNTDYFNVRASFSVTPYSKLDVDQNTRFKPLLQEVGSGTSSTTLDTTYRYKLVTQIPLGKFARVAAEYEYEFLPLEYDIQTLKADLSGFEGTTQKSEITTTKKLIKFIPSFDVLAGMQPSIGYGKESIETKDITNATTQTEEQTIFSFGLEKQF